MLIVFTTAPNSDEAERLAGAMVENKLAACVQILPGMTSFYFWDDEVRREPEHLLLIKTLRSKYRELEEFIRENHSYDVPEIVAVQASEISGTYLGWMADYLELGG